MPVWLERFALLVLAAAFGGIVILNALKLDGIQRTGIGIAILGLSIYIAQTIHLFNQSKAVTAPAATTSPMIHKDNPPPETAQPPEKSPKKHPKAPSNQAPSIQPDILIVEQKEIPSTRNAKYALRVTLQPTKTIQPVHLRLQCDGPLIDADLQEPQRLIQYSYGVVPSETNVAEVTFVFPPIDSNRVVVVVLFSNQQVKVANVRNVY